ncbi:pyridoxamine 5'-phosphate oxidase family protein [Nocardia wallacei]|uniref:pyridoxamine 5'-phosphate oxidase family protein n=1 Tax=Nocardia wallacei TaxID=480035 RepID=UPI0024568478|nr:pyridoxamine 5'-phosphate oxidase family protein [Nocardia wallacei]
MNITTDTVPLVYAEIVRLVEQASDPAELVGVSCIARGADSVFAQAVLDLGGRLEVVIPSRNYRERNVKPDHAEQFDNLLRRAESVRVMDFADADADAYEAANKAVLESCDLLIAVWDGRSGERSGTGSVVALAREQGLPIEVVWPKGAMRGSAGSRGSDMSDSEPEVVLGPFSSPGAQATSWAAALAVLGAAEVFWLSTVRPDGRPHVTPLLAAWSQGGMYFTTGGQERKARNLEHNPHCVLTTGTNSLTGVDVAIEGVASAVDERSERARAVTDLERKYGTHLTSPEGSWHRLGEAVVAGDVRLYRVAPTVGFAFGKLPMSSQTRYTWPRR